MAVGDMHILAYCYHWSRDTLWNMSRSERRMWVKMVQIQKEVERKALSTGDSTPVSTYQEM